MLQKLIVKNFALIENASLDFNSGFTVITGETGSGKSIMLGALKMILGERADFNVIRDKENKTIVEAYFDISNLPIDSLFDIHELDYQSETIIRREINATGKSRAFINDTPVQLSVLKEITTFLVHIHSQHHTINLKSKAFQLDLLDVLAGNQALKQELTALFEKWKKKQHAIDQLKLEFIQKQKKAEFNRFQLEELEALDLDVVDYTEIEQALSRAEKFEEIKASFQLIINAIENENGVSELLRQIKKNSTSNDKSLTVLYERIEEARIELEDVALQAAGELSEMELEPTDIEEKTVLMDRFNAALKKHYFTSQEELITLQKSLKEELNISEHSEEKIKDLERELAQLTETLDNLANKLSKQRKEKAPAIEKAITKLLDELKLPDTKIMFDFEEKALSENGKDKVALLFSPNKGLSPQPIEKAASGGELSRLMLSIQYLLSAKKKLPTVIFDEIDTGVSGEVAQRIGEHLKKMGENMQLFAITHLPQVAGKGQTHILVEKTQKNSATVTQFKTLTEEQRIEEIAKLMSGKEVNKGALENAKNLMNQ